MFKFDFKSCMHVCMLAHVCVYMSVGACEGQKEVSPGAKFTGLLKE